MGKPALEIRAGASARERLGQHGWQPELFQTLVGASGGAKFLGLAGLDSFLFGDFLQRSEHPLHLIGSSIGSWRHAALASTRPVAALEKLVQAYIAQDYAETRPSPAHVSRVSLSILDSFLADTGDKAICQHPRFTTHIVTARGIGPTASRHGLVQAAGLGLAAVGNTLSRTTLQGLFQRVIFSSGPAQGLGFNFDNFNTLHVSLEPQIVRRALHASGSIPFVLTGERDIPGAPLGQYWDGGIVDYHFDLSAYCGEGLILYPHFRSGVTPGWFDKLLPWRRVAASALDRVVLLSPSPDYLASLPAGKIPDRGDFKRMDTKARTTYWETAVSRSTELAQDLADQISGPDPLAGVIPF